MENRIKEQFSLFADRVSAETMRANQLRMYLSAMAYVLVCGLRRLGLKATELAPRRSATIRARLLKIGAVVRVSVDGSCLSLAAGYPWRQGVRAGARAAELARRRTERLQPSHEVMIANDSGRSFAGWIAVGRLFSHLPPNRPSRAILLYTRYAGGRPICPSVRNWTAPPGPRDPVGSRVRNPG